MPVPTKRAADDGVAGPAKGKSAVPDVLVTGRQIRFEIGELFSDPAVAKALSTGNGKTLWRLLNEVGLEFRARFIEEAKARLRAESASKEPRDVRPQLSIPLASPDPAPGIKLRDVHPDEAVGRPSMSKQRPMAASEPRTVPPNPVRGAFRGMFQSQPLAPPRRKFQLPNGRVGLPYQAHITPVTADDAQGQTLYRNVRLSNDVGLTVAQAGEILGTPSADAELIVQFEWTRDARTWQAGECLLTVAPDPKTLWKEIDPPDHLADPYHKKNIDVDIVDDPDVQVTAASVRGRSHAHTGAPRDDDFFVRHQAQTGWSVLVVCDGAGSAPYSRWGARLASKAVGEGVWQALSGDFGQQVVRALEGQSTERDTDAVTTVGRQFWDVYQAAAEQAVMAIESEAHVQGSEPRQYATTLLAAAVRKFPGAGIFVATLWVGDGAIGVYRAGKIRLMGHPDSGEYAGQTQFLDRAIVSDSQFPRRMSVGLFRDASAVLLMSDGVSDPCFETDAGLGSSDKWDQLWSQIEPVLQAPQRAHALAQWMQDISVAGHHDDRTLVVLR